MISKSIPKLKKIIMQLTEKCNSNCGFCMNGGKTFDTVYFNSERYKQVITDLVSGNKKNVNLETVAFTGGEPLLEKELLLELAAFNKQKGLTTMLVSNAILMTPDLAKDLYENGVKVARVSLDTYTEEKYAEMRGIKNSFEKVLQGISYMIENNINVIVRYTLTKKNLDDVLDTYRLCNNLKINEFQLRIVSPWGKADVTVMSSIKESEKAFNELFDIEDTVPITTPCFFLGPCTPAKIKNRMVACPCAREWMYIEIDGKMYPCNYFPKYTCLGNLYENDIDLVWECNKFLKEIRDTVPSECSDCNHWENCYNQCQGLVYSFTDDFKQTCFNTLQGVLKYT